MSLDASHRNLEVPALDSEAVTAASAEHARLLKMYRETGRELGVAQASRHAAVDEDRRAYADALAADKADPGTKHTDAADKRLTQIKRKHEALELAIGEAHAAVIEAVQDDQEDLIRDAGREVDEAADAYREAVDALGTAHARLSAAVGARSWLLRFPEVSSVPSALRVVRGLPRSNGEVYAAATVIAALRDMGDVPEPVFNEDGTLARGLHVAER